MKRGKSQIKLISICLIVAVAILALSACASGGSPSSSPAATSNTNKVLKVGMITPSTGPAAEKGAPGGDAVLDAMEYINKELGGAGGIPIKVSWRDSAYDSSKVVTSVNDFMNEGDLMFTAMSSKEMTDALGIANRAEFPGMATFTAPNLYRPPQHVYGQMPDYGDDFSAFATYYMKNLWKGSGKPKMALHLLNNSTGAGARDAAKALADKLGIDIVDIEEHATTTISETQSLTKIKAANPDVLFISSTPKPTAVILKNAKELGMIPGMVVGTAHASFTKALVDLAGADVVEGVYGVYPTVTWEDNVPGIAKAKEYVQKNHPNDYGNMDYLSCWTTSLVTAQILKTALQNVGYDVLAKGDVNAWRAVEKSGIQKLNGYNVEGLHGSVTYTPGDNRLDTSVKLYVIKKGAITAVSDWVQTPTIKYEDFSWWGK
jgi:branched-chain amino acid transport system substrate-binding protein